MAVERRSLIINDVEWRAAEDGNTATFTGHAVVYDTPTAIHDQLGKYTETIRRGACARALRESHDVPLLLNHDGDSLPLARFPGTMRLTEDKIGLRVEAALDMRSPSARDVAVALERRDLRGMSFAFRSTKDTWNERYTARDVEDMDLLDCSIVTNPAYPTTDALVRAVRIVADAHAGRVLSGANVDLLKKAQAALKKARVAHKTAKSHLDTLAAQSKPLTAGGSGLDADQGGGNNGGGGDPIAPADGLGPRSAAQKAADDRILNDLRLGGNVHIPSSWRPSPEYRADVRKLKDQRAAQMRSANYLTPPKTEPIGRDMILREMGIVMRTRARKMDRRAS